MALPARARFADLDPVPSLDWLEPLSEERYQHADLAASASRPAGPLGCQARLQLDPKAVSLSPAPWMCIADVGARGSIWDEVMRQLARWLIRHLDDPALLLWLVKTRRSAARRPVWWIEHHRRVGQARSEGNSAKLVHNSRERSQGDPSPKHARCGGCR